MVWSFTAVGPRLLLRLRTYDINIPAGPVYKFTNVEIKTTTFSDVLSRLPFDAVEKSMKEYFIQGDLKFKVLNDFIYVFTGKIS